MHARGVDRAVGAALASVAVLPCLAGGAAAAPFRYRAALGAGGGVADNPLSTADLDPTAAPVQSALVRVAPDLRAGLDLGRTRLDVRALSDLARFSEGGTGLRQWHVLSLAAALPLGPLRLEGGAEGSFFGFDAFPRDRYVEGSLLAGLAWTLGAWEPGLTAGLGGRRFLETSESLGEARRDRDVSLGAHAAWSPTGPFAAGAGYRLVLRDSNEPVVSRPWHVSSLWIAAGGLDLATRLGWSVTARSSPSGGTDVFHAASAEGRWHASPWIDLVLGYRYAADRTAVTAERFGAHEVVLGLEAILAGGGERERPPPEVEPSPGGGTSFRTCRRGARKVSVVGDWNGWSPERDPLDGPDGGGCFRGTIPIPPGRHEFQYDVDGRLEAPEGVPLLGNDFGAPNGVLEVSP